ncbi:MAG: osmotically inducible protein OsmC [Flavobacteriaceae bacterium]|jgi:putative redox protein|nr:osmotically inducible protein OsmC [Flavobacteriaceae bacterium]MBQ22597.1 osmotically inducible protein OsmC [Flavobacteriales bacterium]|tara:strand:- start:13922 stop:14350 length:429 start_codon:yes stop_codon:yes gene_type:complete
MKVLLERINDNYLFEVSNSNGHRVLLDNKSKNEGSVKGISPMELLLMGLAGCSSIDVVAILKKQKINPKSIKMEVKGERTPGAIPALFHTINVDVILEGDFLPEKAKRAVDLSFEKYCSVSKTLESTAKINYSIILNGIQLQ